MFLETNKLHYFLHYIKLHSYILDMIYFIIFEMPTYEMFNDKLNYCMLCYHSLS